jgi:hypothetical protein
MGHDLNEDTAVKPLFEDPDSRAPLTSLIGTEEWEAITRRSTEDMLVYLAFGRFRRRPPMSVLPTGLQRDI